LLAGLTFTAAWRRRRIFYKSRQCKQLIERRYAVGLIDLNAELAAERVSLLFSCFNASHYRFGSSAEFVEIGFGHSVCSVGKKGEPGNLSLEFIG